ncbi:hypothetical protein K438DRAFT_2111116 [Mycena galopus ATCC 62051]|nr:hypothetical protein K438DRAFT_2111116 [Mycena galopus ATCC 62051]
MCGTWISFMFARFSQFADDRPRPNNQNRNQDTHFQQRKKFAHFETPYMAAAIPSWRAALAAVDTSLTPLGGPHPRNVYIFPEPALVIGSDTRHDMYLHHYQLIRDALLYRMGDIDEPHDPVSAAEWCDALQGKLVVQGKHKSQAEKRTSSVERILGPALRACGINTLEGFPVAQADIPPMTPARAKEITWELAEMNFHFELCALDKQACGVDRHEEWSSRSRLEQKLKGICCHFAIRTATSSLAFGTAHGGLDVPPSPRRSDAGQSVKTGVQELNCYQQLEKDFDPDLLVCPVSMKQRSQTNALASSSRLPYKTVGQHVRTLLSDTQRRRLAALAQLPKRPVFPPSQRVPPPLSQVTMGESILGVIWMANNQPAKKVALAPPEGGYIWLEQADNRLKPAAAKIGPSIRLETSVGNRCRAVTWDTPIPVASGRALLFRAEGVKALEN